MSDIRGQICKIISEMLDNPDSSGIYPTTKCYDELEKLFARTPSPAPFNVPGQVVGVEPYISPTDKANQKPQGFNPPAPSIVWPDEKPEWRNRSTGKPSLTMKLGESYEVDNEAIAYNAAIDACKSAVAKAGVLVDKEKAFKLAETGYENAKKSGSLSRYSIICHIAEEICSKFAATSQVLVPLDKKEIAELINKEVRMVIKSPYSTIITEETVNGHEIVAEKICEKYGAPSQGVNEELLEALTLILPLAKGYMVSNPIKINCEVVKQAEDAKAKATSDKETLCSCNEFEGNRNCEKHCKKGK